MRVINVVALVACSVCALGSGAALLPASAVAASTAPSVAVGSQYSSTHVYVAPESLDRFVASFVAAFGGTASKPVVTTVTPTPSSTIAQFVLTPAGTLSVFGYKTPVPFPFGLERTGYLVADMDAAVRAARSAGASVIVAPFDDPIGRDAVIQWPGGVNMQLYWHTTAPSYDRLQTVPDNRVYLSRDKADDFIRGFVRFAQGKVASDSSHAPGIEIGRPKDTYRRVRIESNFGKMTVLVTDGHLPYPYGRELTGYDVEKLADTLDKAKAAGVVLLAGPYSGDHRDAAIVQFPGGYIAEIHASSAN
ncbi:MAG: glyoxalase [Stellaceae bacterium]